MTPTGRSIYAVILAADPDLSLVDCVGLAEGEDPDEALGAVLEALHTTSPAELAAGRGWSVLADHDEGGPVLVVQEIVSHSMSPEEALEQTELTLAGITALEPLSEFSIQLMARALLASFGVHAA